MKRIVFHIDVNSAFLSWEASKRVEEGKDDIRLIPSAIGGDKEQEYCTGHRGGDWLDLVANVSGIGAATIFSLLVLRRWICK